MVVWKSEGDEDKFIVNLIKQGKVHKQTSPAFLKATYPAVFGNFSLNVIRNHLNAMKRKNGMFLEDLNEDQMAEIENGQQDDQRDKKEDSSIVVNERLVFGHQNYPMLCQVFKDPETLGDKVVMVISLPGGATNVKIEVNEVGTTVTISYNWPETLFDMQDLFKKQLTSKKMAAHHPMITTVKSELEKFRCRIDLAPEATFTITLPIKVQSTSESIVKWGVKRDDGTQVIIACFTGHIKTYCKRVSDSSVVFDN